MAARITVAGSGGAPPKPCNGAGALVSPLFSSLPFPQELGSPEISSRQTLEG